MTSFSAADADDGRVKDKRPFPMVTGMLRLKFFGVVKDAVGRSALELDVPGVRTMEDLLSRLCDIYPAIDRYTDFMVFLRDSVVMQLHEEVRDGDRITIMIPVSGG